MSRIIIFVLLASVMPAKAYAQPCEDWSTTQTPPAILVENHDATRIHIIGDLMLTAGDHLHVFDATDPTAPILLGEVDIPGSPRRFREFDGTVFLVIAARGLLRLDLTDPEQPSYEIVYDPDIDLIDAARLANGATAVLSAPGDVHILDADFQPVAEFNVESWARCMEVTGLHLLVGVSQGILPIDAGDPANPVMGEVADCSLEDNPLWNAHIEDIVVVDDTAYLIADSGPNEGMPPEVRHFRLVAVDVTEPVTPTALAEQRIESAHRVLFRSGALITLGADITFMDESDLGIIGTLQDPDIAPADACLNGDLLSVVASADLVVQWRLDSLRTVLPVSWLGGSGSVSGEGRYRMNTNVAIEYDGDRILTYGVSDCANPEDLTHVLSGRLTSLIGLGHPFAALIAQDGSRIGIGCGYFEDPWLRFKDFGVDGRDVNIGGVIWCRFDHDVLWTVALASGRFHLVPRDLDSPELDEISSLDLGGAFPIYFNPPWLLARANCEVLCVDCSDPTNPTIAGAHELPFWFRGPNVSIDGTIIFATSTHLAFYDFSQPPAFQFVTSLDLGFSQHEDPDLALDGDLLVASGTDGWRTVSVTDPANPELLSPVQSMHSPSLVLSGRHLYAGEEGGMVHLFDLSDPVTPRCVGLATADNDRPFMREGRLYFGHAILLPDCDDPAPIDEDETDEEPGTSVPIATVLHQPIPNPFNPATTLAFEIARPQHVTIAIHDLRGRRVVTLLDEARSAGHHTITWHGTDDHGQALPSGTYLVSLVTDSAIRTTKAVLIR